ncbi:hypothetical protein MBGDN05_00585 [Thermoplasmatales archaeon SCGC AB-539-N05]|nr:hypothetical protein MBGDN05_00585 [Thermoplasmatales archaeon SCGC AB-539-N05]
MTEHCSICGEPLEPDEEGEGICSNCQASIVSNDGIPPTF